MYVLRMYNAEIEKLSLLHIFIDVEEANINVLEYSPEDLIDCIQIFMYLLACEENKSRVLQYKFMDLCVFITYIERLCYGENGTRRDNDMRVKYIRRTMNRFYISLEVQATSYAHYNSTSSRVKQKRKQQISFHCACKYFLNAPKLRSKIKEDQ